jgi:hypothetical protein
MECRVLMELSLCRSAYEKVWSLPSSFSPSNLEDLLQESTSFWMALCPLRICVSARLRLSSRFRKRPLRRK